MSTKKYLSIDIGNSRTKIVKGGYSKGVLIVYEYLICNTPEGTIEDGKIVNLDKLVLFLEAQLKQNKLKAHDLILSLSGTGVITREIQLPRSNEEELEKMLKFEVQQYFPVELENYSWDYKIMEEFKNHEGEFIRVLLAAAPLNQLDEYMKIHKRLRMEIEAIDLPANNFKKLLFGNELIISDADKKKFPEEFAIVDIGDKTSGIYIFSNGSLKFNRSLMRGSSEIDEALKEEFHLDVKEAELQKINIGNSISEEEGNITNDVELKIVRIVKNAVDNIARDVNRFFEFYSTRSTGNRIEKVFLCGGGSNLTGLDSYLSNFFGFPVNYLRSVGNVEYKGKKNRTEYIEDYVYIACALGGIIREQK